MPTTTKPEKYSWLGADLLPTELPSGVVAMGARSYISKIGRFLQPDPVSGGTDNPYAYTNSNPVNETDVTGDYVENNYSASIFAAEDQEAIEAEAAREQAAREEAERKAAEAAAIAAMNARIAAEEAAIYAQDAWDAEAAAGPPGAIPGGGMAEEGGGYKITDHADFVQCTHKGCSQYCVEHAKSREAADKCPKGNVGPAEECITGAFFGLLVSWIPGVDIEGGEAAAAGCAGALGSPGEINGEKKDD